jgi:hypothetical protein
VGDRKLGVSSPVVEPRWAAFKSEQPEAGSRELSPAAGRLHPGSEAGRLGSVESPSFLRPKTFEQGVMRELLLSVGRTRLR